MHTTNKAIVLSKIKYKDNDLIVKCYTQQRGIVSYLIRGAFKSKNNSIAYYQLLSQLLIEERFAQNQTLHFISEVKSHYVYKTLHTNVLKSAVALFIAEILTSVLQEEEANTTLFDFLETAFQWLDTENDFANFHILFLLKLTKHLGFYPELSKSANDYFNLQSGAFEIKSYSNYIISDANNSILKQLLGMNFDALNTLKINSEQRQSVLNMLLLYIELHLGNFRKPKSLNVFNQVFN